MTERKGDKEPVMTLPQLVATIKALLVKTDQAHDKYGQYVTSTGRHLANAKLQLAAKNKTIRSQKKAERTEQPQTWEAFCTANFDLGKRKADLFISVSNGDKPIEKLRAERAERKQLARKKRATRVAQKSEAPKVHTTIEPEAAAPAAAAPVTIAPEATAPAADTTQTAASKPPLRWIDVSTGEPWDGSEETRTLIGHAADGKEFLVERYLSNMNPVFQVRVTIKDNKLIKTLQQAVAIAEACNADPAPLPKSASKPAAKGDKKKTGAEAPAPRPELTAEESGAERKVQNAAAEDLAIPGFLLRKQANDGAAA